jgi:mono/diheme cytochrome c family protein
MQRHVFAEVIQPILLQRCSACHGPEKHKADLRVDSLEALLKGGKSGPALVAGQASDSPMIHRLLLPLNDEDHMPPEGKPQPTLAEIVALEWWIDRGAPADGPSAGGVRP